MIRTRKRITTNNVGWKGVTIRSGNPFPGQAFPRDSLQVLGKTIDALLYSALCHGFHITFVTSGEGCANSGGERGGARWAGAGRLFRNERLKVWRDRIALEGLVGVVEMGLGLGVRQSPADFAGQCRRPMNCPAGKGNSLKTGWIGGRLHPRRRTNLTRAVQCDQGTRAVT